MCVSTSPVLGGRAVDCLGGAGCLDWLVRPLLLPRVSHTFTRPAAAMVHAPRCCCGMSVCGAVGSFGLVHAPDVATQQQQP